MASSVVVVPATGTASALEALLASGFSYTNPATGLITGFNELGEQIVLSSVETAHAFLSGDNCVQLWRSPAHDLVLSRAASGELRAHLDGYTGAEIAGLISLFESRGIECRAELE